MSTSVASPGEFCQPPGEHRFPGQSPAPPGRSARRHGREPCRYGGTITFAGRDPLFPSAVRLGSAFALSAMAAAVGAAAIWRMRTGRSQDLSIDLRRAAHGINPEFTFHPTINGLPYPNPIGSLHPFTVFPFQTKDGRWVYPSAVYPAQQFAWTNLFDCGANHRSIARAIAKWDAEELEEVANVQGHTLCIARTADEWRRHPQGQYLAREPVIAVRRSGRARRSPSALPGVRSATFVSSAPLTRSPVP